MSFHRVSLTHFAARRYVPLRASAEHCVDVRDTARLHVAALIDPDVQGERLFAMARPFTWKQIAETLKKIRPEYSLPADIPDIGEDLSIVTGKERAAEVLRKNFDVPGFSSLEEMLAANIQHLHD